MSQGLPAQDDLFQRVATIIDEARGRVVRAVNTNMVIAYWLIGREIVEEIQGGEERAEYGKRILADLSVRLSDRFGSGFSVPNLQNFRRFYQAFQDRAKIQYPAGTNSATAPAVQTNEPSGIGFHPRLTWSHYRALMRVA